MQESYGIERFLNVKAAAGPSWSPDGQTVAFATNITGTVQIWSVARDGGWPRQLTFFADRVMGAEYAPVGERLLLHKDAGGNERAQMYILSGDGSEARPLCHATESIHNGIWSRDGAQVAFASNRRDPAYFDIYRVRAEGGEPELLLQHDGTNYPNSFSPDGRYLLFTRHQMNLVNGLYLLDITTRAVRTLTTSDTHSAHVAIQWTKDSRGFFLVSDRDRDFRGLAYMEAATAAFTWLVTPDRDVEVVRLSPDGATLAYCINAGGKSDLFLRDVATGATRQVSIPQGVVYEVAWAPGSDAFAFTLDGSARPMNVWVGDASTAAVRQLTFAPLGGLPEGVFAEAELVSYKSFDGLEIPAWFYRPHGTKPGAKLPVVVQVHGGPESQSRASFNAVNQYFVHRGYAVLSPNVRGSTGYGKAYSHLDDVRKRMDSVADLAACVDFLRASGYVDPAKVIVMGGSYGGFMTLAALTHYPDLWAAGVDTVGIANLETFLENTGAYRRKLRESEYGSLEHDREFFREISPIWHVDKIRAPLFVIHGANDPRVPVGEADQIVAAVKQNGGIVEYLRFDDEGHGLVKLANRLETYPAVAAFLDRHVRG